MGAYTKTSFTDVQLNSYYLPYIEWAYREGVVQGIGKSEFAPDRAIARQEIAVILQRYAEVFAYKLPVSGTSVVFEDENRIGAVYISAVTAIQQAGIMVGDTNNRFYPLKNTTRAEASSILHRYMKLTLNPANAQGWVKNDDGQISYYQDGKVLVGEQTIRGVPYFFQDDGMLKTGWVRDTVGNWRFYSGNVMLRGFSDLRFDGKAERYYFNENGSMVSKQWMQIEDKWYYFYADGTLAKSTKIDTYEVDENGIRITR